MHIGVNARRLEGQRFGVARYIEYMLKFWNRMLLPEERVTVFVRSPFDPAELDLSAQFAVEELKPTLTGTTWENLILPSQAERTDVLFCPSYTAPLRGSTPLVVVTHSLNELGPSADMSWRTRAYEALYRLSARRARRVIVPAMAIAELMPEHYGVPRALIDVVPLGVDVETFRPVDDPQLLRATRRRYLGADLPFILFVGKMSRRRNIPGLLTAFATLKRRAGVPHKLLLFGPNHEGLPLERLIEELGISDDVVQTDGRVATHAELVAVYASADAFVHPTMVDTTSLPILEAFSTGLPVVTTAGSGIEAHVGQAALLSDDPSAESIAAALERVLADQPLRTLLRTRGFEHARRFSWESTARQTLDVLRQVAVESGHG